MKRWEDLKHWWRSKGYGEPLDFETALEEVPMVGENSTGPEEHDLSVTIPPSPAVTAEVVKNAPPMAILYKGGLSAHVLIGDIPAMQADGWVMYDNDELRALVREITIFMSPLPNLFMKLVDRTIEDGVLDPGEEQELHVAFRTWNEADKRIQHLRGVLSQMYRVKEG